MCPRSNVPEILITAAINQNFQTTAKTLRLDFSFMSSNSVPVFARSEENAVWNSAWSIYIFASGIGIHSFIHNIVNPVESVGSMYTDRNISIA